MGETSEWLGRLRIRVLQVTGSVSFPASGGTSGGAENLDWPAEHKGSYLAELEKLGSRGRIDWEVG